MPLVETHSLQLMRDELSKSNKSFNRREDWSKEESKWLHSRLFDVEDAYWFTRQYYKDNDTYDLESKSLQTLMKKATDTFKQWGVTRIHLYAVGCEALDTKQKDGVYCRTSA